MLVQIHMIQNHAPSNLNRDDTGSPKEAVFGGVNRARISSQCLKRSIRQSEVFRETMADYLGVRTRRMPLELEALLEERGVAAEAVAAIMRKATIFGSDKESDDGTTRQLIFLGKDELAGLADQLLDLYQQTDAKAFAKMKRDELEKKIKSVSAALCGHRAFRAHDDVGHLRRRAGVGTGRARHLHNQGRASVRLLHRRRRSEDRR